MVAVVLKVVVLCLVDARVAVEIVVGEVLLVEVARVAVVFCGVGTEIVVVVAVVDQSSTRALAARLCALDASVARTYSDLLSQ